MQKFYFRQLFVAVVMLLCSVAVSAHDFYVDGVYYNITSTTNLTVGVTYRGESPLSYEGYKGSVVIPDSVVYNGKTYSVQSINFHAFYLSKVTSVTIGNNVTTIEESAFESCTGLTNVKFGSRVCHIEDEAFSYCTSLKSVTFPKYLMSIGNEAFYNCSLKSVTIPKWVTSIGKDAFWGCGLTSIVVESGNSVYDSRDNCNAIIFTSTNGLLRGCINTIIPNSVKIIGENAFRGCGLTSVTIPNGVTSIGESAFYNCNFTSVTIPNSVKSIGDYAFYLCYELTSVTIPNSVKRIGENAFQYCDNLASVYLLNETPANITSTTFGSVCVFYVPIGAKEAYKAAKYWRNNYIREWDVTAIADLTDDVLTFEITADGIQFTCAEGKTIAVYTTSGALVEKIDAYNGEEITLDKGVYIVRVGGKAMKVKL